MLEICSVDFQFATLYLFFFFFHTFAASLVPHTDFTAHFRLIMEESYLLALGFLDLAFFQSNWEFIFLKDLAVA